MNTNVTTDWVSRNLVLVTDTTPPRSEETLAEIIFSGWLRGRDA